jgi:ornithine cyclodeaminase/alanine dehydrogenase-like protein (mu-crystallin family)
VLVLTREDVRELIEIEGVIDAVSAAHAALAAGAASQAIDHATRLPEGSGVMLPMAAMISSPAVAGVKLLADVPENAARGLRSQHSTITLLDPSTGRCLAFMDGIEITLQRTAAATAVATRHLASKDVRTLGLVGAGAQARSHLAALMSVRDFERVTVWSRTRGTAERFATENAGCGIPIEVMETAEAVVRSADVLCTLTPSREPLIRGVWFSAGMHVNAVGAPPRPDHREIDTQGLRRSVVVVDDHASALDRSGEVCVPVARGELTADHIHGDLGQVINGSRPGRTNPGQITLFNSVGLALQDMAAAAYVLGRARAAGAGLEVTLS